jgi:tryptophan 7-halogenase
MKKVVIIGGGASAWLTALVVNKFWKNTEVTLIESSKIGILGAGEGGTPNFGRMLALLEINQKEFFQNTGSTLKGGLDLYNWTGNNELMRHLFTGVEPNQFTNQYAYHFDARLVAKYFKQIATDRGVKCIDDEVIHINNDGDNILNLELKDNGNIDLDFVFDCSGFARIVIDKIHNEEWVDYSKYLLLNKAFGYFLPQEDSINFGDKTFTEVISMSSGWMFRIPLQHRWGCGYAFNDNYISVEDAKKEIEDYLGKEVTLQKVFDFKPGTHKRSWIGNSISIGLSYGFIEPLEATALMSTIMQLKRLIDIEFDEQLKDRYNKWCYEINEQNLCFIRYHYLAERGDTPFWRDCVKMPIPTKLKNILDENNFLIPKTNSELVKALELEETSPNELTFFVNNYSTIFRKNKKVLKKELI